MRTLRHYINPKQFVVTTKQIAKLLDIDPQRILNWELWRNVLWVHIQGKGGYFVSYRRLQQWLAACRTLIRFCSNKSRLKRIWKCIEKESQRYTSEGFSYLMAMVREREQVLSSS